MFCHLLQQANGTFNWYLQRAVEYHKTCETENETQAGKKYGIFL